jgi:hypothetical protein
MGRFSFWGACATVAIAVIILLFFPVFLQVNAHFDLNKKRLVFSLFAYRTIKLLGGYIKTYDGGIALHLSKKKAVLIDYSEMDGERKKFKFTKAFKLRKLSLTTETGAEYLLGVFAIQTAFYAFLNRFPSRRGKIYTNLWLTDGDVLRVTTNLCVRFNLYVLWKEFFKFIKERIKILWKKKAKVLSGRRLLKGSRLPSSSTIICM